MFDLSSNLMGGTAVTEYYHICDVIIGRRPSAKDHYIMMMILLNSSANFT